MKRSRLLGFFLCLFLISASGVLAKEGDSDTPAQVREILSRLEGKVSSIHSLRTNFIEEKHLAVLDRPLVLRGTIFMQKPSLFAWHVKEPLRYSMVIRGEVVRQWDEDTDRVQKISLSKNPAFKIAIGQMRDWFSGAYKLMLGEYEVTILSQDPISLKFVPRQDAFAKELIDSVTVVFDSNERYLRQIHIVEKKGDTTVLTFVDTLLDTPIDPSAWKVRQRVR